MEMFLEADAPRVNCPAHGPTVRQVPWARHGAGHTYPFDQQVAWLATQCSKTAITELMRIAWRTVGAIVGRVCADIDARVDRLDGLRRIGIDEISYKRGHKYLTVVVDHDSGRLLWAEPGKDRATLNRFFDALLGGRLTSAASLDAMRQTVATNTIFAYGLGLQRFDLPCGRSVWGHGGELIGYRTYATRADDGRRATLSYNPLPADVPGEEVIGLFASVYC